MDAQGGVAAAPAPPHTSCAWDGRKRMWTGALQRGKGAGRRAGSADQGGSGRVGVSGMTKTPRGTPDWQDIRALRGDRGGHTPRRDRPRLPRLSAHGRAQRQRPPPSPLPLYRHRRPPRHSRHPPSPNPPEPLPAASATPSVGHGHTDRQHPSHAPMTTKPSVGHSSVAGTTLDGAGVQQPRGARIWVCRADPNRRGDAAPFLLGPARLRRGAGQAPPPPLPPPPPPPPPDRALP